MGIDNISITVLSFTILLITLMANCQPKISTKPNLLIVFPDEMRGTAMGFVGSEPVLTPNLDKLAAQSLYLSESVSNYPLCSPFRAMLLTGKYPINNGVLSNCNSTRPGNEISKDQVCWSDILAHNGYDLGYIGKWHLDYPREPYLDTYNNKGRVKWNEWCPPERRHGFNFWYAYGTYDRHLTPIYWTTDATREEYHQVQKWGPEHEADKAIEFLKNPEGQFRDSDKPFALVISMNPPHTPYNQAPQKYLDLYKNMNQDIYCDQPNLMNQSAEIVDHCKNNIAAYYAMITGVDEQLGRILETLDNTGLAENTIILFTSDHGCCFGAHGERTKNNPYEPSMTIPFIIRWPGHIQSGESDLLISVPDFYPTLLGLMGFSDEIPESVEGTNYSNLFTRTERVTQPTSQLYYQIPFQSPWSGKRGIRTIRYTAVWEKSESGSEKLMLYDRKNDPYQLTDISDIVGQSTRDSLRNELIKWLTNTDDPWISGKKSNVYER